MGYAASRVSKALASVVAIAAFISVPMVTAQAEQKKETKAAPKAAEKAPAHAAKGEVKSAWVKLCQNAPIITRDKDGKEVKTEKRLCLTHHERLDGNTGMVLVSAAIREVEGEKKKSLMVMVPLGMAIPPGIRAAIYTKDQWAKAAKHEKIDEKKLKPIELQYSLCHPAGCTAETEATPEILDEMSKGGGIMVLAMNAAAEPVGFPIPLDGYNEAAAGPPVDNKKYAEARAALMKQIRERQQKMAAEWKAEEMKNLPMNVPGAPKVTGSTNGKKAAPAPKK
jgi:invasion protein IalB